MNKYSEIEKRISEIKQGCQSFLEHQRSKRIKGYYKYSYSSDLFDDEKHWNVGSTSYALKIMKTIGVKPDSSTVKDACDYINTFMHVNGTIYDDMVKSKSAIRVFLSSLKHFDFSNCFNQNYVRAETRQCYSSQLEFCRIPPFKGNLEIPTSKNEIIAFLYKLDWRQPWGAGSHFSHLLFFQKLLFKAEKLSEEDYRLNIKTAISFVEKIQHSENGCWYTGNPDNRQKINGAMKVISGLKTVGLNVCEKADKLIDFCLEEINKGHACDNLDIIYVLYNACSVYPNYRFNEVCDFAQKRFWIFMEHYKKGEGGFSFYPDRCNTIYYGATITKGANESDIHATSLFMWGITLIAKLLDINSNPDLQLNEIIT